MSLPVEAIPQPTRAAPKSAAATEALRMLPDLVDASRWGQVNRIQQIATLISDRLEASHPAVAKRLRRVQSTMPTELVPPPTDVLEMRHPRIALQDVMLPAVVRDCVNTLLAEHRQRHVLAKWDLAPRHRILLFGPPGNGKTMLAESLAKELDVHFLVVRYSGLMNSFLGGTGKNLDKAFTYAATGPSVLFVDEFDGIGMDRGQTGDVGELRRVTNQLLLLMDRLPTHVVLVCATNAERLVDDAVKRRFDTLVELPSPDMELRNACAQRELSLERCNGVDLRVDAQRIAQTVTSSLDAVVKACMEVRRAHAMKDLQLEHDEAKTA